MAATTTSTRSAPSRAVVGGRGVPDLVRRTRLVAAVVEGQVAANRMIVAAVRFQMLGAAVGSPQIVNEAGRLGYRGQQHLAEFRRLAGEVEE